MVMKFISPFVNSCNFYMIWYSFSLVVYSSYDSEEGCDSNMQYVRGHIRCAVSCCRGVVSRLSVERVVPVLPGEHKKVVSMSDKFWVWNFWCNDSYLFIEKVWSTPISIKDFMMLWICFESIINFTTTYTKLTFNICFGQNGWNRKHCNLQVTIYLNISNMVEGSKQKYGWGFFKT